MSYHQTIYNLLRQAGMTEAGALGVLGNWECESNCEPYRMQGDFSANRILSKDYVAKVMNGTISRDSFAHDQKGFGLAQWTYFSRKYALYDFWKAYGGALDDVQMQTEFAIKEFMRDFIADWRLLCSSSDIYEAAKAVCYRFENPAVKNDKARYQAALRIKAELQLGDWENTQVPDLPDQPGNVNLESIRTLCEGMEGRDVVLLRALLYVRELTDHVDDSYFDKGLKAMVIEFQKIAFPDQPKEWDGIVGNKTWGELLKRGG